VLLTRHRSLLASPRIQYKYYSWELALKLTTIQHSNDALGITVSTALTRRLGILPNAAIVVCDAARLITLARGQTLLRASEHWQNLWWVERGALRLYYIDRAGAESNKNFFLDDSLFWPITPKLRDSPVGFFVDALEDSRVWVVPIAPLMNALADHEAWAELQRHTLCALLDDKMQREQAFLQTSARQRYEALLRQHPSWADRIALKHLASYLGITDVSLSRLRSDMGLTKG
jgi:CRP-like cAMP-binding protein